MWATPKKKDNDYTFKYCIIAFWRCIKINFGMISYSGMDKLAHYGEIFDSTIALNRVARYCESSDTICC